MPEDRYLNEAALDPPPESAWGKLLALVPPGARVLDVGCGHGAFAAALRRARACRVTGVERNPAFAADARPRCDELLVGDVADLLAARSLRPEYDVVIACDVLEHLLDPGGVLTGLRELLAPGGSLLASVPNVTHLSVVAAMAEGRFPRAREGLLDDTHVHFYGWADVLELFTRSGYAARLADRVVVDPRHTELRTDLSALPAAVLEHLDRNPHAMTYQFIVRAVPEAWARPEDRDTAAGVGPVPGALQSKLTAELAAAERKIAEYHDAVLGRDGQLAALRAAVSGDAEGTTPSGPAPGRARAIARAARPRLRDLRVLYVADRDDAPFRYRCLNGAAQLRDVGVVANVARVEAPDLLERVPSYTMVVLFRLPWSERVRAVVETARRAGAAVAFDIDDLVFDPEVEALMPFLPRLGSSEVESYRRTFDGLGRTLDEVDFCIVTTETLAARARARGKPALVHPNLLSAFHVRLGRVIAPLRRALTRRPYIAYMSGSNTHDGDLASVAEGVAAALRRHPGLSLLLAGHIEPPPALAKLSSRVLRVPYIDHRLYPWVMARCRAVLAPVEVLNDFTHSKSALKVFEAGAFGVPSVVSPTRPYSAAVEHGVSGFVASGNDAWTEALDSLSDRATSHRMGVAARELALAEHSPAAWEGVLAHGLLLFNGHSERPAPALALLEPLRRRERSRLVRRSVALALKLPATVVTADSSELVRGIAAMPRRDRELLRGGEAVGVILADRERSLLELEAGPETTVLAEGRGAGNTVVSDCDDPWLMIRPLVVPRGADTLVVEARARSGRSVVQLKLYWSHGHGKGFGEHRSVRVPLMADGRWNVGATTFPAPFRPNRVHSFRLDPSDAPGEVEIGLVAIVSARDVARGDLYVLRRGLAARFLAGRGIQVGAPRDPVPLPPGASARQVDRLTPAEGDPRSSVASASEDFVVCDHVLGDPAHPPEALREALRVLKPGGHLYVAVRTGAAPGADGGAAFDDPRLERELREACAVAGADLVELQHGAPAALPEGVAVLRRRGERRGKRAGARPAERAILYLLHASPWSERPGGTEYHVRDLLQALRLPRAVVAWPEGSVLRATEVRGGEVDGGDPYAVPFRGDMAAARSLAVRGALRAMIERLGVGAAHVQHLLTWPHGALGALEDAEVPFVWTHHDYYAICPNWNLYDFDRREPCACRPGGAGCLAAFSRATGFLAGADLAAERVRHREAMDRALACARAHLFPSRAARDVFERHLGGGGPPRLVIEHGYDGAPRVARLEAGPRLRVALTGEIAYPIKGAEAYLELLSSTRDLPLEWHVFGDVRLFAFDERLRALGLGNRLTLHGRYQRRELPDLLRGSGIDLCVILPGWDETFSYVLSEALLAGVPAIGSTRGALRQRIADSGAGIAVGTVGEAASALRELCADCAPLARWTARADAFRHRSVAASAEDHRALYRSLGWVADPALEAGRPAGLIAPP